MNWHDQDVGFRKGASDLGSMPFPPGVGSRGTIDSNVQNYDVITPEKAIDESNVGNRMLRNMGWTEGLVFFLSLPLLILKLLFITLLYIQYSSNSVFATCN